MLVQASGVVASILPAPPWPHCTRSTPYDMRRIPVQADSLENSRKSNYSSHPIVKPAEKAIAKAICIGEPIQPCRPVCRTGAEQDQIPAGCLSETSNDNQSRHCGRRTIPFRQFSVQSWHGTMPFNCSINAIVQINTRCGPTRDSIRFDGRDKSTAKVCCRMALVGLRSRLRIQSAS